MAELRQSCHPHQSDMAFIFKKEVPEDEGKGKIPTFEVRTRYHCAEHLGNSSYLELQLSSSGNFFQGNTLAAKLSSKRQWPLFASYGFAALSYHRGSDDEATKVALLDMKTLTMLMESPKAMVKELRRAGTELVAKWNKEQGGERQMGQRDHPDRNFVINEVEVPHFDNRTYKSEIRLILSTFQVTRTVQHLRTAKISPDQLVVSVKLATNVPPRLRRKETFTDDYQPGKMRLTNWGIYLPLPVFEQLALSKEMSYIVKQAKNHLEKRANLKKKEEEPELLYEKEEEPSVEEKKHSDKKAKEAN